MAVQKYRIRRYRVRVMLQIEDEILRIRTQGLTQDADVRLWKGIKGIFKEAFSTTQTWNITREYLPRCSGFRVFGSLLPRLNILSWSGLHYRIG